MPLTRCLWGSCLWVGPALRTLALRAPVLGRDPGRDDPGIGKEPATYRALSSVCRLVVGSMPGSRMLRMLAGLTDWPGIAECRFFIPPATACLMESSKGCYRRGDRRGHRVGVISSLRPGLRHRAWTILRWHYSSNRAGKCQRAARMWSQLPGEDSASYTLRPAVKAIAAGSGVRLLDGARARIYLPRDPARGGDVC